jgi:hypothetical protein
MATLVDFYTTERDLYAAATDAAGTALDAAQKSVASAQKKLGDDAAALDDKNRDIALKRALLAQTTVPSDAIALVKTIAGLVEDARLLETNVQDDKDALTLAQLDVAQAQAAAQRAKQQKSAADAALAAATTAQTRRDAWKAQLLAAPLNTIRAAAGTALTTLVTPAQTQLGSIPTDLNDLITARYNLFDARLARLDTAVTGATTALTTKLTADGGLDGAVAAARITFQQAEAALATFATQTKARFDRAVSLLQAIAAAPVLSASETTDIAATDVVTAGTTSADAETKYLGAQKTVDDDQGVYDDAVLAAEVAHPDQPPTADHTVVIAGGTLSTDSGTRDPLRSAFEAGRGGVDAWGAIIPDLAWHRAVDFLEAQKILTDIKGPAIPPNLAGNCDTAETAYVTALAASAQSARGLALLNDALARLEAADEQIGATRDGRLFLSVRTNA